jgi:hypothetical protein
MQAVFNAHRIANGLIEFNFSRLDAIEARRRARREAARTVAGWMVRQSQRLLAHRLAKPAFRSP